MLRNSLILTFTMLAMAKKQDQVVSLELTKTKSSYLVNVVKIGQGFYKSTEEKHHYAVDPEVKVYASPDNAANCPDTIMPHFPIQKLLVANMFAYKPSNGNQVIFKLSCDSPCKDSEICTVFGCQLKSLKDEL